MSVGNEMGSKRLAVVLFNLGGPDGPEAVEPFLFNLFNDKAIISVPQPFRWLLAKLISKRRAPVAREIYKVLGGRSPIVPLTQQQAAGLEKMLNAETDWNAEVFTCMRYWHPRAREVAMDVALFEPDQVVLLPLYPQFSTTTSGSSLAEWKSVAAKVGLIAPTASVCCHPVSPGFLKAHRDLLETALAKAGRGARILFSAHGLPKKIIAAGDPYQWQVEQTAAAVVRELRASTVDWRVCYQSRVGPMEWIGPSIADEIRIAGEEGKPLVIVPIAFVSEHSETLVELDLEYRDLADACGVPAYIRVPALGANEAYIETLAELVDIAITRGSGLCSGDLESVGAARICPSTYGKCPMRETSA